MAVTRESKTRTVERLTGDLRSAGSIVLADFTGIDVESMTDLRAMMRESDVTFTVVKNTLLRRVLDGMDVSGEEGVFAMLEGPTAIAYAEDEVQPVKLVKRFADEHEGRPAIKGGFVSGETYGVARMMELAELPGREELLSKLVGSAAAPLSGFVSVTGGIVRKLFYALQALRDSRENG